MISANNQNRQYSKPIANETQNSIYKVQCFPLYSILLAIGRTEIDYFSLDVEGSEYKILETVPWNKVDIQVRLTPNGRPTGMTLYEVAGGAIRTLTL